MPFLDRPEASIFYQDVGEGPPVVTTHGFAENHLYWSLPGVATALAAAGFRVISMDMRGHGRSAAAKDVNADVIAQDIGALADRLELRRFHLLTHATGGMAGVRYAMSHHPRLLSLMSTNAGSATFPTDAAARTSDPGARFDAHADDAAVRNWSNRFRGRTWVQIIEGAKSGALKDPFLNSIHRAVDPRAALAWYETCSRLGDPDALADFIIAFFTDPDPRIADLRQISCPCLVVTGENDSMFLEPSRQLGREIPDAKLVVMEGRGHMLAFEDPARLIGELTQFLRRCEAS